MEQKNNYTSIIITIISVVILLTVIPIINGINEECPPCEEIPSYNIGNVNVNPDFSSGNIVVGKGSYDYLDNVTIIKDENLIPENIKKDVNIFGIVGTYEEEGGLPINHQGMGVLFVSGYHANLTASTSLPPEGRIVCNDGSSDLNIEGTLITFRSGTSRAELNYSFLFLVPLNYVIKEFQLNSNIAWDRDYTYAVASINQGEVSTIDVTMESGYTKPNQFSKIFSFTTPPTIYYDNYFVSVNLGTLKD